MNSFAILGLISLLTAVPPERAPIARDPSLGRADLAYRMSVGSKLQYRASSSTRGEISLRLAEAEPHRIPLISDVAMEMELEFLEVRPQSLVVRQRIAWITLDAQVSASAQRFDSRLPAESGPESVFKPLFENLRGLVGKALDFEVKDLGRSVRYRPETLQALDELGGLIQPEDLTALLEAVFPPLPTAAGFELGYSETFARPVQIASLGQLDLGCSQEVTAIDDQFVEFRLAFRPTLTPPAGQDALSELGAATVEAEKHAGTRRARRRDGAIESASSELALRLGIQEQDLKVTGAITLSSQVQLIER